MSPIDIIWSQNNIYYFRMSESGKSLQLIANTGSKSGKVDSEVPETDFISKDSHILSEYSELSEDSRNTQLEVKFNE